jgi:hypothetical protein
MNNEMKTGRKVWLIIPFAVVLVLAGTVIFYIGFKEAREHKVQEPVNSKVLTEVDEEKSLKVVANEKDVLQVDMTDIDEIINSKAITGDDIKDISDEPYLSPGTDAAKVEEQEENMTGTEEEISDQGSGSGELNADTSDDKKDKSDKSVAADQKKSDSKKTSNGTKKDEKVKIVDESPKTIVDEKVNEYKGGEKSSTGNSFMDSMPKQTPVDFDVDGDIPAGGGEVGTWN